MREPTIDELLTIVRDDLALAREKAAAINRVSADLLARGFYVYRQEMPNELHHLLAIRDDDPLVYRFRVLTHAPLHGMDDLMPGEVLAVAQGAAIEYRPALPDGEA